VGVAFVISANKRRFVTVRALRLTGLIFATAALTGISLASASAAFAAPAAQQINLFISTSSSSSQYAQISQQLGPALNGVSEVTLAFATFSSAGTASLPALNPNLVSLLQSMPNATIALSVGGAVASQANWSAALANPSAFAASMATAEQGLRSEFGRRVAADIDDEYPTAAQESSMTRLIQDVASQTGAPVTVEVSTYDYAGFNLPAIARTGGVLVDVMALDNAYSSTTATDNASGVQAISEVQQIMSAGVHANQLSVELPAYGMEFPGVTQFGQVYTPGTLTPVADTALAGLPVTEYPSRMASSTMLNGNLVSLQSPADIAETLAQMASLGVTTDSVWQAGQATLPVLQAAESNDG
jgi:Glycosyl hydrolases family 18